MLVFSAFFGCYFCLQKKVERKNVTKRKKERNKTNEIDEFGCMGEAHRMQQQHCIAAKIINKNNQKNDVEFPTFRPTFQF